MVPNKALLRGTVVPNKREGKINSNVKLRPRQIKPSNDNCGSMSNSLTNNLENDCFLSQPSPKVNIKSSKQSVICSKKGLILNSETSSRQAKICSKNDMKNNSKIGTLIDSYENKAKASTESFNPEHPVKLQKCKDVNLGKLSIKDRLSEYKYEGKSVTKDEILPPTPLAMWGGVEVWNPLC